MTNYRLNVIGEHVLVEAVEEKKVESEFSTPDSPADSHAYRIVAINPEADLKVGDIVLVASGDYSRSRLNGKDYFTIKVEDIIGKLSNGKESTIPGSPDYEEGN